MPSRGLGLCCSIVRGAWPLLKARFEELYPEYELRVIQTMRATQEQRDYYAIGRTKPGKRVTDADGVLVKSNHQVQVEHGELACHAADGGIFKDGIYIEEEGPYEPLRALAAEVGLHSGWLFPKADADHVECPHVQPTAVRPASNGSVL